MLFRVIRLRYLLPVTKAKPWLLPSIRHQGSATSYSLVDIGTMPFYISRLKLMLRSPAFDRNVGSLARVDFDGFMACFSLRSSSLLPLFHLLSQIRLNSLPPLSPFFTDCLNPRTIASSTGYYNNISVSNCTHISAYSAYHQANFA